MDRKRIKPEIGMHSLVWISSKNYPLSFGNYFSFRDGGYCPNMWAENLEEYVKRYSPRNIEIVDFDGFYVVTEKDVSKDWLNKKLCLTGCGRDTTVKTLKEIFEFTKATNINEFICGCEKDDEFTDHWVSESSEDGRLLHCNKCNKVKQLQPPTKKMSGKISMTVKEDVGIGVANLESLKNIKIER